ncbi:MAG TPA: amino acid synthesis family protein [Cellulomonas sp.]
MSIRVRKIVRHREETLTEMGRDVQPPHIVAAVLAVIENPFPPGYVADLVTLADAIAEEIGLLTGPPCVELLGAEVEAYGKVAVVGSDGELEQGSALIHNLRFGNVFRAASGGTTLLPAAEKVGTAGCQVDVPLKHLTDATIRSHHQTVTLVVPDAPHAREILVGCVAANGGRPLARLAAFGAEVAG